ncbi:MAG: hypothetical protein JW839_01890 [Candidatus Lokiarchaeota archaeon]|nr:hypothetical protein [Candidatus Lokiarchaeota archaeon]
MGSQTITIESPLDRAVYQRGTSGLARIRVAGVVKGISKPGNHRLTLEATDPRGKAGPWVPLRFVGNRGRFAGSVTLPSGGWFRFRVDLRDASGVISCSAAVDHVGVGEVFITAGQSNAANSGMARMFPSSGLVSARTKYGWVEANDPQPVATNDGGSPWPAMADALVEALRVPVGIVSVGVGGTAVSTWVPGGASEARAPPPAARLLAWLVKLLRLEWDRWPWLARLRPKQENFSRLEWAVRVVGKRGARAILWHQGESDSVNRTSTQTYAARLKAVIAGSRAAAGWDIPWLVARASFHTAPRTGDMQAVADGQGRVVDNVSIFHGPTTDDMLGDRWRAPDLVHFNGAGLAEHGRRWARSILEAFFKGS